MRQPEVVAIAAAIGLRRARPWMILAIALFLTCGIMRAGNGGQGATDAAKEKAIAALEKLGAKVFQDESDAGKPVIGVDLNDTGVTDGGADRLRQALPRASIYH